MAQEDVDKLLESLREISDSFDDLNRMQARLMKDGYTREQALKKVELEQIRRKQQLNSADRDLAAQARALAKAEIDAERQAKTLAGRLEMAAGASVASQKALLVWGNRLNKTGQTMAALGGGLGTFAKGLAEGGTKFTDLNPIIDGVTNAIGKMAESIPFAGEFMSGSMKLAAEGAKFMLTRMQEATDAFQEISRVGGLSADGMTGVMRQFQSSAMTLGGFKKAIAENAQDLAAFGGTVGKGAERFSKISQEIVDSGAGDYLRRLGFTADEMGESTARFIGQQTRLGFAQGKSFQQLAKSSAEYLRELDLISKITGQSREEQQKRLTEMMREGRFLATLQDLDEGRANQLKLLAQTLDGADDELSAAIRDASSGLMDSETVRKFNTAGIDIIGAVDAIKYGGKNYQEVLADLQRQTRETLPFQREMAKVLQNNNDVMPQFYKQNRFATMELDKLTAQTEQTSQQNDQLTDAAANAQKSMEQMSRQMSALSTTILPKFASVIETVTDVLNEGLKKMGVKGTIGGAAARPAGGAAGAPGAAGGGGVAPTGAGAGGLSNIREMIAQAESRGDYNVMVGGAKYPLTDMTVAEVMDLQKKLIGEGKNSAAGKYQIKYSTLADIMGKAGVGRGDKFNQATQDRLADALIMRRGYNQYSANPTAEGKQRFLSNLAQEWAGLPAGPSGESYYKGVGNNKATIGWQKALDSFNTGGIATGPKGGYTATLHGTEAIVPLPDGKTIPVTMPNFDRNMEQQVGMLGAQLVQLEELVRYMRENTSISAKILQAANN